MMIIQRERIVDDAVLCKSTISFQVGTINFFVIISIRQRRKQAKCAMHNRQA